MYTLIKKMGDYGAFIVEQYWVPDLNFDYEDLKDDTIMKRLWSYRYKPDEHLLNSISKTEMYRIGNDKDAESNFLNPVLVADSNGSLAFNSSIKWGSSPEITRDSNTVLDMLRPNGAITTRFVYYLNNDLTTIYRQLKDNNLSGFTFKGYLADNAGDMIPTSYATGHFYIADTDHDGTPDDVETTDPLVGQPRLLDIYETETKVRGLIYMDKMAKTQEAYLEYNGKTISDLVYINPNNTAIGQGSDVPIDFTILPEFEGFIIGSEVKMIVKPSTSVSDLEPNIATTKILEAPKAYNPYRIPVGFKPTEVEAKTVIENSEKISEKASYEWTFLEGIDATTGATPGMVDPMETYNITINVSIPDSKDPTYIHELTPSGKLEVYFEIEIDAKENPAEDEIRIIFDRGDHGELRLVSPISKLIFETNGTKSTITVDAKKNISWSRIAEFVPTIIPKDLTWVQKGWNPTIPVTNTEETFVDILGSNSPVTYIAQYLTTEDIIKVENSDDEILSGFTRVIFSGGENGKLVENIEDGTILNPETVIYDVRVGKVTWSQLRSFIPDFSPKDEGTHKPVGDKDNPLSWSPNLWADTDGVIVDGQAGESKTYTAQFVEIDKTPPEISYSKPSPYEVLNNKAIEPILIYSKDNIDSTPQVLVTQFPIMGITFTNAYSGETNFALTGTPIVGADEWDDSNGYEKYKEIVFDVKSWDLDGNYAVESQFIIKVLRETSGIPIITKEYKTDGTINMTVISPNNQSGTIRVLDLDGKELIESQVISSSSRIINISNLENGQNFQVEFVEAGKLPVLTETQTIEMPTPEKLGLQLPSTDPEDNIIKITNSIASDKEIKFKIDDEIYTISRDENNVPVINHPNLTVEREEGTSNLYVYINEPLTKEDLNKKTIEVYAINYFNIPGPSTSETFAYESLNVTIYYSATAGGNVSASFESIAPTTGTATGSTATPSPGYNFVNWTDSKGIEVSTELKLIPQKVNGQNVAEKYTANFELKDIIDGSIDVEAPEHIVVTFAAGEGVSLTETKTYKVKPETTLPDSHFPKYSVETGYENPTWIPSNRIITENNKLFTLSAIETLFNINTVKSIEIITQPKLSYTEGDKLDLSSLAVKLTDENNKTKEYNFADFGDIISTSPINGTLLNLTNNNTPVSISVKDISTNTNNLNIVVMEKTAIPTINKVTVGDNVITGNSEPNAKVTLNIGTVEKTTDANEQGVWSFESEALVVGTIITARAQVSGRSISDEVTTTVVSKANVTISYKTGTGGMVNPTTEIINPDAISSTGSTATPIEGYDFINWTDSSGEIVGTNSKFAPKKPTNGYIDSIFTANFRPHIYENINDETIPESYYKVSFRAGTGTILKDNKSYKVKPGITLADSYFPEVTLETGYKDYTWSPIDRIINNNIDFIVNASMIEFDKNNIEKIQIETQPEKLSYTDGENLDLTGLTVKLTDKNKLEKIINLDEFPAYNLSTNPINETILSFDDNGKSIKISLNDLNAETSPITVTEGEEENTPTFPKPPTPPLPPTPPQPPVEPIEPIEPKPIPNYPVWGNSLEFLFEPSPGITKRPVVPQEPIINEITGAHRSYITGYPDGTFRSDGFITRSEAATLIVKLKGYDISDISRPNFSDIKNNWANGAINALVRKGIMKGYPDGTFKPDDLITRGEIAQVISFIDSSNHGSSPFSDISGHWAEKAITQEYLNGRIKGYQDGTFKPDNPITRAETVTMLNRLSNRKTNADSLVNIYIDIPYKDLDKSHWAYFEILEGSISHTFKRKEINAPEIWTIINN